MGKKINPWKYAARVDTRILERDLRELQRMSIEEGLTYKTFIASILHNNAQSKLAD